jgi:hypothetical protein
VGNAICETAEIAHFAMMFQRQGVRDSSPEALPFLRHSEGRIFALPGTFH